ncbi:MULTISPECIES: HepT-like ribonuclease domain-containing protein [Mycolicibacter]|uniref:HepT-like ribonuclease domain-containing protein n=1 Tax=[Mycobacterium] vasticus TaxID=2875777 RepID=A0ABU5Z2I5_9MYCO|nr:MULTISPECIES: HepT-like ribonuclease domain-containing protein [unclassified Mycolicibacter]MEB3064652.1 HepT-like ribonuclease domain-containing protein [Mycolicibacter sp. MYC101]MEB3071619.1 HepT-like ribonuclease domain-containing protein [Mycolicibacter sp. MYC017]
MDDRNAEQLLYIDATLAEMIQLASRGRQAYIADIAVARACQYNIIRLAADLERLGEEWITARPGIPWRLIKGMRNRIAHNYWTVDDDVVWAVVDQHAPDLRTVLADEIEIARSQLDAQNDESKPG